ncbi:TetR/AcrR family transcriptional regulator [Cryobacterium lactosi]|uniref:TetR/AcrR family transcriptional regulator n=1 Tax=Cryobacterium lactosi TaxID=1259202 RepID=A0A4R9BWQ1_9MICO|nr:TetR/AcrR family transcriptional regulator [Cryobacterium lactosi]
MPRPRKFDETEVVASASRAFAKTGCADTSVDDLVAATGLGRQSLYNAFGGKKELFMRALLSDTEDAVAPAEALRHGVDSPIVRIRAQLLRVVVTYGSGRGQPPLLAKAAMELSSQDPKGFRIGSQDLQRYADPLPGVHHRGSRGRRS